MINDQFIQEKAKPYDHPDLNGITCDQHSLVELKQFDYDGPFFPGLYRKNTVFEVILPLARAVNSMYWAHGELVKLSRKTNIKVRLDPLLVHNKKPYAPVFLKMRVWGKPLDWNAISRLKQVDHSQWIPEPGWQEDVKFTDLVWTPRNDGIHFICEEVPKIEANRFRGSRYLHGIYEPQKHTFIHCDGAIRIYTRKELIERHESHVRKIGKRIKTFLIEGEISTEEWTNLTCANFVWNEDIQNYFSTGIKLHS